MGPVHWDDAEVHRFDQAPLAGAYADLGELAGSVAIGVGRFRPDPGSQTTPVHAEGGEEEITFVLAGSGWSVQDGVTYAVGAGDALVHHVEADTHTLVAGDGGLDVLAFGERAYAGATYLPRAGVVRIANTWVEAPGPPHPWERECAAGPVEVGEPAARPDRIVALADVAERRSTHGPIDSTSRDLGRAAGSVRTGLRHITIAPGRESMPPHVHSAEEELFVVLDGAGVAVLGDDEHPVRAGSVLARPAGTRVAHAFRAGGAGLVMLAYGQRDPSDLAYYPRSHKVAFRGLGLMVRVSEHLDYFDGEPE